MKQQNYLFIFIGICTSLFLMACDMSESKKTLAKTKVKFKDSIRHYYAIPQGKQQDVDFTYYNTGENPLAILEVQSSCGCAKVEYPDRLIEPEGEGTIMVHFDSHKNIGYSEVFITVIMNTEPVSMHTLIFDLNIVPNENVQNDYEETYERIKEENKDLKGDVTKLVEGDETEAGYYTDSSRATLGD